MTANYNIIHIINTKIKYAKSPREQKGRNERCLKITEGFTEEVVIYWISMNLPCRYDRRGTPIRGYSIYGGLGVRKNNNTLASSFKMAS